MPTGVSPEEMSEREDSAPCDPHRFHFELAVPKFVVVHDGGEACLPWTIGIVRCGETALHCIEMGLREVQFDATEELEASSDVGLIQCQPALLPVQGVELQDVIVIGVEGA